MAADSKGGHPNPTLLIVPGACHTSKHWAGCQQALKGQGWEAVVCQLPSNGSAHPHDQTVAKDTAYVQQQLLQILDQGQDAVLVLHSYAGAPGGTAALGLSKPQRQAEDSKTGVAGIIFLAAIITDEIESLFVLAGNRIPPMMDHNVETGCFSCKDSRAGYYSDLEDGPAAQAMSWEVPISAKTHLSPVGKPAWHDGQYTGRLAYIRCTQDQALPLAYQNLWLEGLQAKGVDWHINDIESGHHPAMSQPEQLSALLAQLAEKFSAM